MERTHLLFFRLGSPQSIKIYLTHIEVPETATRWLKLVQLKNIHWKTYYCTPSNSSHFKFQHQKMSITSFYSYKNTNIKPRDQISTETLYCMFTNSCTYSQSMLGICSKGKLFEIKHHCQSTGLVCNLSETSESVFFFLQIKGRSMEKMTVTYEKRTVMHHKNIQQSTVGQYSQFVIDFRLQEIQRRVKVNRGTSIIAKYNCK